MIALIIGGFSGVHLGAADHRAHPLHRTEVVLSYMYDRAFGRLWFGYGAAISYILAAIIVSVSAVQMKLFSRPVEY